MSSWEPGDLTSDPQVMWIMLTIAAILNLIVWAPIHAYPWYNWLW